MKNNNFDILRYFAVFSVMLGHFALFGFEGNEFYIERTAIMKAAFYFRGVVILFAMSGFLVASSFEKTGSVTRFLAKRFIRIYPGLWVCTLVNFVILFFLAGDLFDKSILAWLFTQIPGIANTPECLRGFATGSINGALWSVFVEIQLYVLLMITYSQIKKVSNFWLVFIGFVLLLCNVFCGYVNHGGIWGKMLERIFLPYAIWFYIGMVCYLKGKALIPIARRYLYAGVGGYVFLHFLPIDYPGYYVPIYESILLPFIVIGAAYKVPGIRCKIDLTYGMYLYHWIVLNVLMFFGFPQHTGLFSYLTTFIVCSLIFALLSWKFVEDPCRKILSKGKEHL